MIGYLENGTFKYYLMWVQRIPSQGRRKQKELDVAHLLSTHSN